MFIGLLVARCPLCILPFFILFWISFSSVENETCIRSRLNYHKETSETRAMAILDDVVDLQRLIVFNFVNAHEHVDLSMDRRSLRKVC